MTKPILTVIVIFTAIGFAFGQNRTVKFEHLTVEDGLSQNTVGAILKDHKGFMWFGTNDGLNRYDGSEFRIYKRDPQDSTSLSNNKIYCLLEDHEGFLWVGTANGLNRYSIEKDHFKRYYEHANKDSTLSHNFVRYLYEDRDSTLWAGTLGGGLNRYDRENDCFIPVKIQTGTPIRNVTSIIEDDRHHLWIGSNLPGIHFFNTRTQTFEYFPFPDAKSQEPKFGKNFYKDHSGRIWIGSEGNGLYLFDPMKKEYIRSFHSGTGNNISNNIVKDITQIDNNTFWIATDGGGINVLNMQTGKIRVLNYSIANPHSISSNAVYSLYRDNHGIYWVGTFDGGINTYNTISKNFKTYTPLPSRENSLSHRSVLSFHESHTGKIWIGTDGGGMNLFDPENEHFTHYRHQSDDPNSLNSDVVTEVFEDHNHIVWIGTYGGGLNRFDPETGNFRHYLPDPDDNRSIANKDIWDIHEDGKGNLWIASMSGLDRFNRKTGTFTHFNDPNNDLNSYHKRVTTISEDHNGTIWLGGSGLRRLNRKQGILEYINYKLFQEFDVRCIYEDTEHRFWVGTEGGGLVRYNRDSSTFTVYNTDDGLPNDAVHAILEDEQGNLWLSTNKGLSKFNPESLSFQNYQESDGLQSNQFSYDAALKSSTGALYFGGIKGFNKFYPSKINKNPYIPPVVITNFEIMSKSVTINQENSPLDKHISVTEELTLTHKQDVFSFEFKGLSYSSNNDNQYMIKMEGFDEDWRYLGNRNYISFTNLPAGDYTFKVKAANNDGIWNEEGTSVRIHMLPPPWRTKWAYMAYALLFIGLLYAARTMLLYKARMKHKLQLKEVEKNKIKELNNMKIRFYTNVSHEFRTPLTLIISPLEHLLSQGVKDEAVKKNLSLMHHNAKRLLLLMNQLMDFRRIETGHMALHAQKTNIVQFVKNIKEAFNPFAREHQINFQFHSDFHTYNLWFDREKIEKIIYNLLSNAFKFTPDRGSVTIKVQMPSHRDTRLKNTYRKLHSKDKNVPDYIHIIVEDTGLGISRERLSKIFDRFHQIPSSSNLKSSLKNINSGIGLALTKSMIELHKGFIDVESEEGKGSRFIVSLPIGKKHLSKNQLMANLEGTNELKLQQETFMEEYMNNAEQEKKPAEKEEQSANKLNVLVIEDDQGMQNFIRDILKDTYNVSQAMDGIEGLEKSNSENPDIIISDIMMKGKDGITLSKELKQKLSTSHIPIILLTALSSDQYRMEGYEIGADEYITKPFNPDLLKTRMQNLIEKRERMREHFRRKLICEPSKVTLNSLDEEFLKKAVNIVEENISNPQFNVPQLIEELGTSRSALYRKLRSLIDQSANEFIRSIRMKRAAQLLAQNQLNISEISYRVGYNDPQYFSKSFKKEFNMTPSEYMQQHSNNGEDNSQKDDPVDYKIH